MNIGHCLEPRRKSSEWPEKTLKQFGFLFAESNMGNCGETSTRCILCGMARTVAVTIEGKIRDLALSYARDLKSSIDTRLREMESDDRSHFLIYQVLGIGDQEGRLVDEYQNKGRFLYRYAGSFLEDAAKLCFLERYPTSGSVRIPNTQGRRPKTFEIDCLVGTDALEIKWRDATTDGDHITKEHTRIQAIVDAKYTPIRVMFYYPNRAQAIRIQQALETLYKGVGGRYFFRDAA